MVKHTLEPVFNFLLKHLVVVVVVLGGGGGLLSVFRAVHVRHLGERRGFFSIHVMNTEDRRICRSSMWDYFVSEFKCRLLLSQHSLNQPAIFLVGPAKP